MTAIIGLYVNLIRALNALAPYLLPTLARFAFAAVMLLYFWGAAATKFDGIFTLSAGAYGQVLPLAYEAAGFDESQLGIFNTLIVYMGSYGEIILPLLLILGLATRVAALGMVIFVIVQSLTDIYGFGVGPETIGYWFDRNIESAILDQRTLWVMTLLIPAFLGAGPISLDAIFKKYYTRRHRYI